VVPIMIELESSEFKLLKGNAHRQIRTPENLARFLILRGLGFTVEEQETTNANSDVNTGQGSHVAVAA